MVKKVCKFPLTLVIDKMNAAISLHFNVRYAKIMSYK